MQKLLQKSIDKLSDSQDAVALKLPSSIEALSIDLNDLREEVHDYQDDLVQALQGQLSLPKEGRAYLYLTLNARGGVEDINIVVSSSEELKEYLQSHLRNVVFPAFNKELVQEEKHTFCLTLHSE